MEINELRQMSSRKILETYLKIISEIYTKYTYLYLNNKQYYDLVLMEITKSKRDYNNTPSYEDYLKNQINISLQNKTKELLESNSYSIINNIINIYFNNNYSLFSNHFQLLDNFLNEYNYIPTPDVLIELINNNELFRETLKYITNKYYSSITTGGIEEIFDNRTLISSIEAYCLINNITIEERIIKEEDYEPTDSLGAYYKEIRQIKLLSFEEEQYLASEIRKGNQQAKKKFIESNLRLVISIAKRYVGRGLSLQDLIQEGNLGLITAVDKYDYTKGYKFSTYATHWIKQNIIRSIYDKGRNIRIPNHMYERINRYKTIYNKLESELSREPSLEEIAKALDISLNEAAELSTLTEGTVSINSLTGEDSDTEFESCIASSTDNTEEEVISSFLPIYIISLFKKSNLNNREIEVLVQRFGLDGSKPKTLEELGEKYHITKERTRQIEANALRKIRNSNYIEALAIYMNYPEKSLENLKIYQEKYQNVTSRHKSFFRDNLEEEPKEIIEEPIPVEPEPKTRLTPNDYYTALSILRSIRFRKIMSILTTKEALILILKTGYIDDKQFTDEEITSCLNITQDELDMCLDKIELYIQTNASIFTECEIKINLLKKQNNLKLSPK